MAVMGLWSNVITPTWYQSFEDYDDLLKTRPIIPFTLQTGFAFNVTSGIKLFTDYRFLSWDSLSSSGDEPDTGGFGWEAQHIIKPAINYQLNESLLLRGWIELR